MGQAYARQAPARGHFFIGGDMIIVIRIHVDDSYANSTSPKIDLVDMLRNLLIKWRFNLLDIVEINRYGD